ncbi:MAG: cyclic nucleotide-binding domain-containing protein [Alphaproteobacteria bacterium]|nr:cyclic nucleotide-binding domain-containing protein [Alphaproteobacteria bacterium]
MEEVSYLREGRGILGASLFPCNVLSLIKFKMLPPYPPDMNRELSSFLESTAKTRTFRDGEVIVRQGQLGDCAYVVKTGAVIVYRESNSGDLPLATLGQGEIFGEMALLRFDTYTLSVKSDGDSVLYILPPSLVNDQIRQTPPMIRQILSALLDRMHEVNTALLDLDQTSR